MAMGKLEYGKLTQAWQGEASDFTPELAANLDLLDRHLGLGLTDARIEVPATGGRRIDILASGADDDCYVIENQYNAADHDHLTRGLAYAVSAKAQGLIVVAEKHKDEFRAVAAYLNDVAAQAEGSIRVWLVEAQAVRIDDSLWAPLFSVVEKPNALVAKVADSVSGYQRSVAVHDALASFKDAGQRAAATQLIDAWHEGGFKTMALERGHGPLINLLASGPASNGKRVVITLYANGKMSVPLGAYAGQNSGRQVPALASDDFQAATIARFGLDSVGRTPEGWLTPGRVADVLEFSRSVNREFEQALHDELSAELGPGI